VKHLPAAQVRVQALLNGLCDDTATLHLLGGDLKITWDKKENTVYMEGPAETVFTGEWQLKEEN
jgi:diaminopimelate epimerase